ncbi:putative membrane protein [Arthrobacter pigmenti]|uniref:Putative membrane protein n=1 Tax=Arthrobacter pigmenti TaxID=271432 RepID=A0A846S0J2_9MICC|nr:DUF1648 domain-containing protein [Arthrobacter pigmenti]NJC23951.1 putative membrane protein [Arthrobacter pigmenti]
MGIATQSRPERGRYKVWLTFPVALLILAGFFWYGASLYDSLPERIPTHWGPSGQPDAWAEKSFGSVFSSVIVGAGVTILMAFISALVSRMVPPREQPTLWEQYRRESMIRGTVAGLGLTSVGIALLTGALSASGWNDPEYLAAWPAGLFVMFVLVAIFASYAVAARWARTTAARDGVEPTEEEAAEDKLWIAGVLYNNVDDPHVWVPKREGTGYGLTVNVGTRKGRAAVVVFLALVSVPLLLIAVLPLVM